MGEADHQERWERRARKLAKRREGMQVTGAGLKKVLLPLLRKKAEEAAPKAPNHSSPAPKSNPRPKKKRKKR